MTLQGINVIADSSSTRTEWVLVEGDKIVEHAFTQGLNPYFQSRREISHSVRLELPQAFFRRRWDHVYFYGAGCNSPEKIKTMESSLVAQFKTPVTVESDLTGAARGLLIGQAGLACILDTGSNSCFYDGKRIVKNVRAGGFILGDEGSGAALGRIFLSDVLKDLAPADLTQKFLDQYNVLPDDLLLEVYNNPQANFNLSRYASFLAENLDNDYVRTLVHDEFMRFFRRTVAQYDYKRYPVSFVGSVATKFSHLLVQVSEEFGAQVKKIMLNSMPGLIAYHAQEA